MQKAKISMEIFNPKPSKFDFQHVQTFPSGEGQASSLRVQFDVNHPAAKGAVFVDSKNDGLVKVTAGTNHIITNGWAVIAPDGSFTKDGTPANKINASVAVVTSMQSNKELWFLVKRVGSDKGNVTMTFFVQYVTAVS